MRHCMYVPSFLKKKIYAFDTKSFNKMQSLLNSKGEAKKKNLRYSTSIHVDVVHYNLDAVSWKLLLLPSAGLTSWSSLNKQIGGCQQHLVAWSRNSIPWESKKKNPPQKLWVKARREKNGKRTSSRKEKFNLHSRFEGCTSLLLTSRTQVIIQVRAWGKKSIKCEF